MNSVSVDNLETCRGLEQLAMNANPSLLSNCARDSNCTQVTCQPTGLLAGQLDLATIVLSQCEMPPGVVLTLLKDGNAVVNQLITVPTMITHDAGIATVEANVFVNSTTNSVGILVNISCIQNYYNIMYTPIGLING